MLAGGQNTQDQESDGAGRGEERRGIGDIPAPEKLLLQLTAGHGSSLLQRL